MRRRWIAFVLVVFAVWNIAGLVARPDRAQADASDPVVVAAGDVALCPNPTAAQATAALLEQLPGTVLPLGDNVYRDGTAAEYTNCYAPTWGAQKARSRPVPGNHEYNTAGASGYYGYFGAAAGDPKQGYYSYNLGSWHLIALNANCTPVGGCGAGSPQEQWLKADLAAAAAPCTLAYWHQPRYFTPTSSLKATSDTTMSAIWSDLQAAGTALVLSGHHHVYERFARQDATGNLDPNGIRQFIVGTGGGFDETFTGPVAPNSEVRKDGTNGVLKLTLHSSSYDWQFIPVAGETYADSGTDSCRPGNTPTPNPEPTTTTTLPTTTTTLPTTTTTQPATTQPPVTDPGVNEATTRTHPVTNPGVLEAAGHSGYWITDRAGEVFGFGSATPLGNGGAGTVHLEPTPAGNGYWILNENGQVFNFGDAPSLYPPGVPDGEKAVSLSSTPTGKGYWIFTDEGRVLLAGDARFFGDMSGTRLAGPVLGSVATPTGHGYWMVASDGGIFAFGDATFHGSTGNLKLNKPVMSMAPAPDGSGYWLVASDGGIFAFDVPFYGSMGATRLNKPISGMVPGRAGYMMVGQDGGIFSFGSVAFHGSLGANPPASPVVGAALQP